MRIRFYALWLSLICVIIFALQLAVPGLTDLFLLNSSFPFEIWRFVTAIFLHGSLAHLISNLFALALFGTILEFVIGSRRFLIVFSVSGIVANLVAINFYNSSLGASGAIYGVLGTLVVLMPLMIVWVYGLPMPLFAAGIFWVGASVLGLFAPSDIGDIAHLSGIAVGFIFGIIYRTKKENIKGERINLNERYLRSWEARTPVLTPPILIKNCNITVPTS